MESSRNNTSSFFINYKDPQNLSIFDIMWKRITDLYLDIPIKRPSRFTAIFYGVSGAAFSWGLHTTNVITSPKRYKDSIKSESINIGLLNALVLTVTLPLTANPPSFIPGGLPLYVYASIGIIGSHCLAFGMLLSITLLTHIEAYESGDELNRFRRSLGVLCHSQLHLMVLGGLSTIGLIFIGLYYLVSYLVFFLMIGLSLSMLSFVLFVISQLVLTSWDTFCDPNQVRVTENPMQQSESKMESQRDSQRILSIKEGRYNNQ